MGIHHTTPQLYLGGRIQGDRRGGDHLSIDERLRVSLCIVPPRPCRHASGVSLVNHVRCACSCTCGRRRVMFDESCKRPSCDGCRLRSGGLEVAVADASRLDVRTVAQSGLRSAQSTDRTPVTPQTRESRAPDNRLLCVHDCRYVAVYRYQSISSRDNRRCIIKVL